MYRWTPHGPWARCRVSVRSVALGGALALGACARPHASVPGPAYVLRDTTEWATMLYGGAMAVLYRDGVVLDTVDLLLGVQAVPGGIVYQPVRKAPYDHEECRPDGRCFDLHPWVLRAGRQTRDLTAMVPAMHPFFSSPNVIDSVLYYWGITAANSGPFRISAMKYDFRTRRADSTYLFSDGLETDNPGYFVPPALERDLVVYATFQRRFHVTRDLRIVSKR